MVRASKTLSEVGQRIAAVVDRLTQPTLGHDDKSRFRLRTALLALRSTNDFSSDPVASPALSRLVKRVDTTPSAELSGGPWANLRQRLDAATRMGLDDLDLVDAVGTLITEWLDAMKFTSNGAPPVDLEVYLSEDRGTLHYGAKTYALTTPLQKDTTRILVEAHYRRETVSTQDLQDAVAINNSDFRVKKVYGPNHSILRDGVVEKVGASQWHIRPLHLA
jgi:hypothetical protein